ncbi:heterokaryon incompatibility protein-domain-containing protein [Xylogone sp. PMI_703]|nr:heterokaryon incompatibility protein-domain-containing protein [Xylogone sp. PMI_703]
MCEGGMDILPTESSRTSRTLDESLPGQAVGKATRLKSTSTGQLAIKGGESESLTAANVSQYHDNSTNEESREELKIGVPDDLVLYQDTTDGYYLKSKDKRISYRLNSSEQLMVSFGPQVASTLCPGCQRFNIQSVAKKPRLLQIQAVQCRARDNGCAFCALLLRDLQIGDHLFLYIELQRSREVVLYKPELAGLGINKLRVTATDRYFQHTNPCTVEFSVAADQESAARRNQDISEIFYDFTIDQQISTIVKWHAECATKHPLCRQTASGEVFDSEHTKLPTRCINTKGGSLILQETDGLEGTYIALTHRWTLETNMCQMTTGNYDARLKGESFGVLPHVFLDAFEFARRVEVDYVWIDSLCIIQSGDEGQDFEREAPKMAQYYQHASFVLAGTTAMESRLFCKRFHNVPSETVRMPYREQHGRKQGHFYVCKRQQLPHSDYSTAVFESQLLSRGWVFQEFLLSRRFVTFTNFGVFFECATDPPHNVDDALIDLEHAPENLRRIMELKKGFNYSSKDPLSVWYELIRWYSGMSLTKPEKDRIAAIAGIAKEYQNIVQKQQGGSVRHKITNIYVAGLWLTDLHYGLLWWPEKTEQQIISNAPSWSWASILTKVKWPSPLGLHENGCRIIGLNTGGHEYSIDMASPWQKHRIKQADVENVASEEMLNTFSVNNISASLKIQGKLQTLLIREHTWKDRDLGFIQCATNWGSETIESWRAICSLSGYIGGWATFDQSPNHEIGFHDGIIVKALHVSTGLVEGFPGWSMGRFKTSNLWINVLLIECVEGKKCKRIGVGRIFEKDIVDAFFNTGEETIELV